MDLGIALGYCAFAARGSRGIIDVLFFDARDVPREEQLPIICAQIGTTNKPIAATLVELDAAPRPIGSLCVVARRHRAKNRRISWTYHTLAGKFATLAEAIDART